MEARKKIYNARKKILGKEKEQTIKLTLLRIQTFIRI
jgi:hypothetical protein